ncbi:MAG TPA: hypothetical protein VEB20_09535 [Azospirillaceae bacterium]|nr:hypothetical protein [Azospirillaceae bacterium]
MPDPTTPQPAPAAVFDFQHRALRLENALFTLTGQAMEPVLQVDLGDARGTIPLRQVQDMFAIPADSPDGRLLQLVASGLKHVRFIRHGDRVPSEILDGTASWSIDDRHREMALIKIGSGILKAITGSRAAVPAVVDEGDEAKRRMREAAAEIAALAGLPPTRKQEVVDRIEVLANELAYLEALRDHFKPVFDIPRKLREMGKTFRGDRELDFQLRRIQDLLKTPVATFSRQFEEVDAGVGEPVSALKQYDATVKLLRRHRDALHYETMAWGDIPQRWRTLNPAKDEALFELSGLYRFLAGRYLTTRVWAGG